MHLIPYLSGFFPGTKLGNSPQRSLPFRGSAWARNAGPSSEIAILKPNSHRAADMFVDETRDHQRVRRNEATRLYRANWLKRHPKDDPESLPYIAGAAAVFEERVWSN